MVMMWLGWSALGIVWGLFVAWIWIASYSDLIIKNNLQDRLPKWLRFVGQFKEESQLLLGRYRHADVATKLLALCLLGASLLWYQWGVPVRIEEGLKSWIVMETSFPVFVVVAFLVPVIIYRRYLKKLASRKE